MSQNHHHHQFVLQPSPPQDTSLLTDRPPSTKNLRRSSSQTPTSHRRIHSTQPSSPFITVLTGRSCLQRALTDNDPATSGITPRIRIDKLLYNTEQDSHNLSKDTVSLTPFKPMAKPRKSLSTFGALTARAQTPTTKGSWNASPGSRTMFRLTSLSKSGMDGSRNRSPRKLNKMENAIVKVQDIIEDCNKIKEENVDFGKTLRIQIRQEASNSPRSPQNSPKNLGIIQTEETPKSKFNFWKTNEEFVQERAQLKQELKKQRDEEFRKEELRKLAEEDAANQGTYREDKSRKPININEVQEPTGMTKFILQKPRLFQGAKAPTTTRRAERLFFDPPKIQDHGQETGPDPTLNIQGQILTQLTLRRPSTSVTVATHKKAHQGMNENKRTTALLALRKVSDETTSQFNKTLSSPLIKALRRTESGEMSPLSSLKMSPILTSIRNEPAEEGNRFLFRANSIEKKGTLFDLDAVREGEDHAKPSLSSSKNNFFPNKKKGGPEAANPVLKKTASMVLAETLAKVEGKKVQLEVDPSDLFMSFKRGLFKGKGESIQNFYRAPVPNSRTLF